MGDFLGQHLRLGVLRVVSVGWAGSSPAPGGVAAGQLGPRGLGPRARSPPGRPAAGGCLPGFVVGGAGRAGLRRRGPRLAPGSLAPRTGIWNELKSILTNRIIYHHAPSSAKTLFICPTKHKVINIFSGHPYTVAGTRCMLDSKENVLSGLRRADPRVFVGVCWVGFCLLGVGGGRGPRGVLARVRFSLFGRACAFPWARLVAGFCVRARALCGCRRGSFARVA